MKRNITCLKELRVQWDRKASKHSITMHHIVTVRIDIHTGIFRSQKKGLYHHKDKKLRDNLYFDI